MYERRGIRSRGGAANEIERRFLELIERNEGRIRRICRSWSRVMDPGDLESEVHLELWRALPSFGGRSKVDTWAYQVIVNTVLARVRSARRGLDQTPLEAAPEPVAQNDTHRSLEQSRTQRDLHRALDELPDVDRALMLLWLEEVPYQQIAEIVGLTNNHVGVRLHRLRRQLVERLRAENQSVGSPS